MTRLEGSKRVAVQSETGGTITFFVSHAEFTRCLNALLGAPKAPKKGKHLAIHRGRFARDAELRLLVRSMLDDGRTIDEMAERLSRVIGPERTPSRSALGRYTRKLRIAGLAE